MATFIALLKQNSQRRALLVAYVYAQKPCLEAGLKLYLSYN